MSSFTQKKTTITDKTALIKTLEDKGYKPVAHEEKQTVRGHGTERLKAEIILKKEDLKQGGDIGFNKKADGTYEVVTDVFVMRNGFNLNKFTEEINRDYTKTHIAQELRKKNLVLKRQIPQEDGSVQLIYEPAFA